MQAIKKVVKDMKRAKKKKFAVLIALDFSGAFDSISWNEIMRNATRANLDNTYLAMLQSLLTSRKIKIENQTLTSERGTPQGGRASPLLYRIGANRLLTELNQIKSVRTTAFADDTALVASGDSENELKANVKTAINVVQEWARAAEIKLNADKTGVMTIGRKAIRKMEIGEKQIQVKLKLLYLGTMLDSGMRWKDHLVYLNTKTEKLLLRLVPMCWWRGQLRMREKVYLYRRVFLPMMTYAHEVWYREIKNKTTYIDIITRTQRRVLKAITGAYRNANSSKILEITNELPIEKELEILSSTMNLCREERGIKRDELREGWRSERELNYEMSEGFEFEQIRRRETVWCLTETGPFRSFLLKIGKEEEDTCRLCGEAPETAQHLLFSCNQATADFKLENDYNTDKFERSCANLIAHMKALE